MMQTAAFADVDPEVELRAVQFGENPDVPGGRTVVHVDPRSPLAYWAGNWGRLTDRTNEDGQPIFEIITAPFFATDGVMGG